MNGSRRENSVILSGLVVLVTLAGCGSSNDNSTLLVDITPPVVQEDLALDDTDITPVPQVQCDAGDNGNENMIGASEFDIAELFFTEPDRQWFCNVSSVESEFSDEIFFDRQGTATFSRFGLVYWNRDSEAQAIRIASPFVATSVLSEVFSANTVLQFQLDTDDSFDEVYDCVLTTREITRL